MLGKLLKHEIKAMARLLLPLYLVLAVLTVMDRVVLYLDIFKGFLKIIPGFITLAYVLSIVTIIVVCAVIIILRFYKNLMTDEGYLMFTLPVKSHELINSKLIASFLWALISITGVIVSIVIVSSGSSDFRELCATIKSNLPLIREQFGPNFDLLLIEFFILLIIGTIYNILIVYISIAIGQLFNGHKLLGSFVAYIAINVALQVIMSIVTVIAGLIFRNSFTEPSSIPQILLPVILFFVLIISILYYLGTNFIFRRKLNLE